MAKKDKHLDWL